MGLEKLTVQRESAGLKAGRQGPQFPLGNGATLGILSEGKWQGL